MKTKLAVSLIAISMIFGLIPAAMISAEDSTSTPTSTSVDLPCMQTAVEKRDNAVISAWDALSALIKTALQTRRDALKTAWGITNRRERTKAVRDAWTAFRQVNKKAQKTFRKAKKDAWKQFKIDRKACRATSTGEREGHEVNF